MVTSALVERCAVLVAVNVTRYSPPCVSSGLHSKRPLIASKNAPRGRLTAVNWTGIPEDGSTALTVKLTKTPDRAACFRGTVRTGAGEGSTSIV